MVPIKLDDGKIIQYDEDETIEMRAEFTNYSHQEFTERPTLTSSRTEDLAGKEKISTPQKVEEILRFDAKDNKRKMPTETPKKVVKERVIPIKLENTGRTITPTFTKLEDPQPPEWSAFSQKNMSNKNAKEIIVPIRMVDIADEESISVAGSEYENAPKQRREESGQLKWSSVSDDSGASIPHNEQTGARSKGRHSSHSPHNHTFSNESTPKSNKRENFFHTMDVPDININKVPFNGTFSEASNIPSNPNKSPTYESKTESTTDTKKILSKTTKTTKTTTEKRSQTVRFDLEDDDEGRESKSDTNKANGKKPKFENSRMR